MPNALDILTPEPLRRQTRPLALEILDAKIDDDLLRVESIQGQESISQPYEFEVEVRADDNPMLRGPISFENLMGKRARLRIGVPWTQSRYGTDTDSVPDPPEWENSTPSRFFQGIVGQVSLGAPGVYSISLKSSLYRLTLRNRYYIYDNKSIQDVIRILLEPECLLDRLQLVFKLDGAIVDRIQDWMQAGESDFAFLQRLMAKESIHFFFIHEENSCTLVFSNQIVKPNAIVVPGSKDQPPRLRYTYTAVDKLGQQQSDLLMDFRYLVKMTQNGVRSATTRAESDWESNALAGFTSFHAEQGKPLSTQSFHEHKVYQFGVNKSVAIDKSSKAWQQIMTGRGSLSGNTTSPLLSPGYSFQLMQSMDHNQDNAGNGNRPQFDKQIFVVTKIEHKMSATQSYQGSLEASSVDDSTLLTPFSMENTQQGSVLAKVLRNDLPKGWQYREKSNFDFRVNNNAALGEHFPEMGCLVQLATATGDNDVFWIRLAQHMQIVPEVGAMVLVSRSSTENELPEIQSVISSHGSKCIQPPDRAKASWQANTMWGSSYSTNYGDGISLRYGNGSAVNFEQAKALVEKGYDKPCMEGSQVRDSSFSMGGSFSVSISDNGDAGLSGASISQGCNYSESHGKHSYSYSSTKVSENVSLVGKSVSRNVVGEYNGNVDLNSPNFIAGKLPDQSIRDIADRLQEGDSYSQSTVKKRSINLSGVGTEAPSDYDSSAVSYSNSITLGKAVSKSKNIGRVESSNTVIGSSDSVSEVTVKQSSLSTIGISQSDSFVGISSSNSTTGVSTNNSIVGSSVSNSLALSSMNCSGTLASTNISATGISTNISVTGVSISDSSTLASVSTSSTLVSEQMSTTGVSNSTSIGGVSNSDSLQGVSVSSSLTGVTTSSQLTGVHQSTSIIGVSDTTNISGVSTTTTIVGVNNTIDSIGPGFKITNQPACLSSSLDGVESKITIIISIL